MVWWYLLLPVANRISFIDTLLVSFQSQSAIKIDHVFNGPNIVAIQPYAPKNHIQQTICQIIREKNTISTYRYGEATNVYCLFGNVCILKLK